MEHILWEETISLGFTECETCGGNVEEVMVIAYSDGTYYVMVSVGCYSGDSGDELSPAHARDLLSNWTHLDPRVQGLIERIKSDLQK